MVNENYEPTATEEQVIDVMQEEWRANPMLIREKTSLGKGSINTALSNLTSAGWVLKVTRGLYQFVEDPRKNEDETTYQSGREQTAADASPDDLRQRMEATLAGLDVPGRPAAVERTRREAIKYAWDRLREVGEMPPSRLADDVMGKFFEDDDLGYSVSSQHPGYQLLDNVLRDTVRELPGVHSTGRVWQFREEDR